MDHANKECQSKEEMSPHRSEAPTSELNPFSEYYMNKKNCLIEASIILSHCYWGRTCVLTKAVWLWSVSRPSGESVMLGWQCWVRDLKISCQSNLLLCEYTSYSKMESSLEEILIRNSYIIPPFCHLPVSPCYCRPPSLGLCLFTLNAKKWDLFNHHNKNKNKYAIFIIYCLFIYIIFKKSFQETTCLFQSCCHYWNIFGIFLELLYLL